MPQQIGRLLLIQIGDGNVDPGPETFSNLCGLTTRSFNLSANDIDTTIPSCDAPEETPQKTGMPGIKNRTFSGSGKFVSGVNSSAFMQHVIDATAFNAKVIVPGLGTFTGEFYVTEWEFAGETEGSMDFSGTFVAGNVLTFDAEVAA